MPSFASLTTTLFRTLRFISQHGAFWFLMPIFSAIVGVFLSNSSPFEASSAMFWMLTILPVILIIYAHTTLLIMPSFLFRYIAYLLRSIAQHVAFGVFMSTLFDVIGMCFPDSSLFQEISIRLWVVSLCLFIYNANTILEIMPYVLFTSIADLLMRFPRHECFGNLIQDLVYLVHRLFRNSSSPLEENTKRTWTFFVSKFIYRHTGDVISGSLACTVLISFLISYDERPIYVFFIWAICLVLYLKSNRADISGSYNYSITDSNSITDSDSITDGDSSSI